MKNALKVIAAMMLLPVLSVSCTKPDEPNNGGNNGGNDTITDHSGSLNGRVYVDLGLPSGILWAAWNVGAETPEGRGEYFAWGETVTKDIYDWKSYQYSTFVDGHYELNKYCTESSLGVNGVVDSLTVLELTDDAARANWGDDWRMPTKEEWDELFKNTTCICVTQNGVEGRLLTGSNGNSIFLPETGFCLEGEAICTGLGVYWSSTLQTGSQVSAWSFHFDRENCHVCGTYERSRGQCVRAVRSL